jgi:hypothetical protein
VTSQVAKRRRNQIDGVPREKPPRTADHRVDQRPGVSSSGKSFTTETTVKFFPPEAVIEMTAMSERALVYSKEDYKHRTLVLYEAVALREGNDDNLTSYFVRSLLSESRIEYPVTVRGSDGNSPPGRWSSRGRPT